MKSDGWNGGIAIVDDEKAIVEVYCKILEANRIPIAFVAYDGEEACRKFREARPRPKVVLMDFRMPAMNGLEASKQILSVDPSAKIIFISADSSVKEEAFKTGATGFIQKPASLRQIIVEVKCARDKAAC